jgi:hypothetical protein
LPIALQTQGLGWLAALEDIFSIGCKNNKIPGFGEFG